jgi:hypothetical protein
MYLTILIALFYWLTAAAIFAYFFGAVISSVRGNASQDLNYLFEKSRSEPTYTLPGHYPHPVPYDSHPSHTHLS